LSKSFAKLLHGMVPLVVVRGPGAAVRERLDELALLRRHHASSPALAVA
jgi:hypothetical protein